MRNVHDAHATGLMTSHEPELASIAAAEHAQHAKALMQQICAFGRMPKESHDPKESRLARELRDARATELMTSYEAVVLENDHGTLTSTLT